MSKNQENKEEEVDLGALFTVIGNGFRNFFNFIGKVFVGLYHFIILAMLFVRRNIVKLSIAAVIGGGTGAYMEFSKDDTFGADLLVQPNFGSSRQLYNNIGYYNNLIAEEDSVLLAETFKISPSEAATLKGFKVEPIKSNNDKIEQYHQMVRELDTVATMNYSFDQFKSSFTDFDYKFHNIHVEGSNSRVFYLLEPTIIQSIVDNEYLKKVKEIKEESLYRKDSIFRENLVQLDTLRRVYMQALLEEAKKDSEGTNIDLGAKQSSSKELLLFRTNRGINSDLDRVSEVLTEQSEVVNVISNFQRVGYKVGGITKNSIVVNAAIAVALMILIILLLQLNRYLANYKQE